MIEDHGRIPVETTEGWRPGPSRGERVVVGLAALALIGAALIIGGNLLNRHDEVSSASGSPSPTSQPSPSSFFTPFPTPTPREIAVEQQTPQPTASSRPLYSGWIRALADLTIHDGSDGSSTVIGTVPAGTIAYIDEQGQGDPALRWSTVEGPEPSGWVATQVGGQDMVKRYSYPDLPSNGGLWSLAAGPNEVLAIGTLAGGQAFNSAPTVYRSSDGVSWQPASGLPRDSFSPTQPAWGPAGWLMASSDGDTIRLFVSPDGERWSSPGVFGPGYAEQVLGSTRGYMLQGGVDRSDVLWFSLDAIHWTESRPNLTVQRYFAMTATSAGFYASASSDCCGPGTGQEAKFSLDGLTWSATKPNLLISVVNGNLVGIEPGVNIPGASAYRGSFYRGRLDWHPLKGGDQPFEGAIVTSLVSDGHQATAFGWNAITLESLSWTSEGGPWTRHEMPAAFEGPPSPAAARAGSVVVVGYRENWRGSSPVIWHRPPNGSWEPEQSPLLGEAPDPTASECGIPPSDPVDFVTLDRQLAVVCYGDRPLTIRMWSGQCDGCYGQSGGTYQEPWLSNPSTNYLFLSPVAWPGNWFASGVLAPELGAAADPSWVNAWLELTGHFDDPASVRCRWVPPLDQLQNYSSASSQQDMCRQQFVVTHVKVVDGP